MRRGEKYSKYKVKRGMWEGKEKKNNERLGDNKGRREKRKGNWKREMKEKM